MVSKGTSKTFYVEAPAGETSTIGALEAQLARGAAAAREVEVVEPAGKAPPSLQLRATTLTPRNGFSTVRATETAAAEIALLEAAEKAVADSDLAGAIRAHDKYIRLADARERPAVVQAALKSKGWEARRVEALLQTIEKQRQNGEILLQTEAICSQLQDVKQIKCCTAREKYMDEFTASGPPAPHNTPVPQQNLPPPDPMSQAMRA
jgi:hypothetical protein